MSNPHKIVIGNITTWCVECEEVNDSHLRHKDESSLHNFPTERKKKCIPLFHVSDTRRFEE